MREIMPSRAIDEALAEQRDEAWKPAACPPAEPCPGAFATGADAEVF